MVAQIVSTWVIIFQLRGPCIVVKQSQLQLILIFWHLHHHNICIKEKKSKFSNKTLRAPKALLKKQRPSPKWNNTEGKIEKVKKWTKNRIFSWAGLARMRTQRMTNLELNICWIEVRSSFLHRCLRNWKNVWIDNPWKKWIKNQYKS